MSLLPKILKAIGRFSYCFSNEAELQNGLAVALSCAGIEHAREVILSKRDRIDFLAGDVGVEVKIKGGITDLTSQLFRYAGFPQISALVVVAGKNTLANLPAEINGKPVHVVRIARAFS
jgi:hypothetical protein